MHSKKLNREIPVTIAHAGIIRKELDGIPKGWICDHWVVTGNGFRSDYYTGAGFRAKLPITDESPYSSKLINDAHLDRLIDREESIKIIELTSRPTAPDLDDWLFSVVEDAEAAEMTFEDWAREFGYDTDSRKALEVFLACQAQIKILRALQIDPATASESFRDY
jgi:hypothetical protein